MRCTLLTVPRFTTSNRAVAYYVYILASRRNGTLYVGATSDIVRRVYEHKQKVVDGFTERFDVAQLVYFEMYEDPQRAIQRERNIKHWKRTWKVALIERDNPEWHDLYDSIAH